MTATNVRVQMQQRRDTAANWTSTNPTLLNGELGYETDTKKFKIGNGTAVWSALAYVPGFAISAYPLATADIADSAITAAKIADDAVTAAKIANTSVTAGSYTTANITVDAQGRVTSAASGASAPPDGSVTTAKLANDAVTGDKLANDITIANNLTVTNDLTVNGTTTTIDSTTLVVEDKNIEIGKVSTPSDTTADGGGITLKGATDKTLTWVDSTDCWTFNQALNLTAGTAGAPALVFNGDVNSGLFQPGADSLAIATGGTQRITVDSSGNVGIGTPSPVFGVGTGLEVFRSGVSTVRVSSNNQAVELRSDAGAGTLETRGAFPLKFGIQGSERMRIDSSGRLLVGTTTEGTPASDNLTLQDSGSCGLTIRAGTSDYSSIFFSDATSGVGEYAGSFQYGHSDNTLRIGTNSIERMRIDSSGQIKIPAGGFDLRVGDDIDSNAGGQTISVGSLSSVPGGFQCFAPTNGQSYLQFGDGSAAASQYRGYVGYKHADDALVFGGAGTERMRIDSSGNVGIGLASPQTRFHSSGTTNGAQATFGISNSGLKISTFQKTVPDAGVILDAQESTYGTLTLRTRGAERLRIDSSGRLLINSTSGVSNEKLFLAYAPAHTGAIINTNSSFSGNSNLIEFKANGTTGGSITFTNNGTSTAYVGSSDYRLKENVVDLTNGITRIKQLQPKRFNFIAAADTTVDGFLAHEAQIVVPEAVTGTHDEVDDKGNPVYQGIDQAKLVPLLTSALQEAIAKIETLEKRLSDAGIA